MSPDLGLCDACKERMERRGVGSGANRESDRILTQNRDAFVPYMELGKCYHCGDKSVLLDAQGKQPLWCGACERRRKQIASGGR
jgi:hypothetical protein